MTQISAEQATVEELLTIVADQARAHAASVADLRVRHRVALQAKDQSYADLMEKAQALQGERDRLVEEASARSIPADVVPGILRADDEKD